MDFTLYPAYSFHQLGQRQNQEDARYPAEDIIDSEQRTFIVCDGVGGLDKGERASQTVSQAMGRIMERFADGEEFTDDDFAGVLGYAYSELDRQMNSAGREMATTMTMLHFHNGGVYAAYIGDSRIYQIRPGSGVIYRSFDHSYVNLLVRTGNLSPADADNHPKSNVITRCMGGTDDIKQPAETFNITDVEADDYFLLCTDGVLHCLNDEGLVELLSTNYTDEEKIKQLAQICINSSDNNTATLIHIAEVVKDEESDYQEQTPEEESITRPITEDEYIAADIFPSNPDSQEKKGLFSRLRDMFS